MAELEVMVKAIERYPGEYEVYDDAFQVIRNGYGVNEAHALQRRMAMASRGSDAKLREKLYWLNRKVLCFCAPDCFDDYIVYMESGRDLEKQFYLPRRKQLRPIAKELQRIEDGELDLLGISLPPGVGKSTLAFFFLTWTGGRHPELSNIIGSHSNAFLRGAYDELLRLLDPQGEYKWNDVFPKLKVVNTNAKDMMIDLGENVSKRFATFEAGSVGSGNAGRIRASNFLICDDLVDSLETAMSKDRMDKLYDTYAVDLRQRKTGGCREIHIATRWSIYDVLGRLEETYGDDPRAEFIKIPALNENDESNFDYPIPTGFTTKFYHEQREAMDEVSWKCLFMNQPVEREGLLYEEDRLQRYYELPEGEPDAIIAVCDTKDRGVDYCVMPIAYQYGQNYYIEDVVCDNSAPEIVEPRLTAKCLGHQIQMARFESNSAGGRVAEKIQKEVKEKGGRTRIETKFSSANKETRIIMAQPWILEHCLFRDLPTVGREYRRFVNFICTYTLQGKNKHDDAVDALAMLSDYAQSFNAYKATVMKSPFAR